MYQIKQELRLLIFDSNLESFSPLKPILKSTGLSLAKLNVFLRKKIEPSSTDEIKINEVKMKMSNIMSLVIILCAYNLITD